MGEARRRKVLEDHIKAVCREGQGVHHLDIYRPDEALEALGRALGGDTTHKVTLIWNLLREFRAKRGTPQSALCFCCGGPVPQFAALVALMPHIEQPTKAIGGAICPTCDGTDQQLRDRVIAAWRKVDPSTRPIKVHQTAGRA